MILVIGDANDIGDTAGNSDTNDTIYNSDTCQWSSY